MAHAPKALPVKKKPKHGKTVPVGKSEVDDGSATKPMKAKSKSKGMK